MTHHLKKLITFDRVISLTALLVPWTIVGSMWVFGAFKASGVDSATKAQESALVKKLDDRGKIMDEWRNKVDLRLQGVEDHVKNIKEGNDKIEHLVIDILKESRKQP